ncbi:MAG: L-seryl-tRNA(Sec) selenium transferase [Chloroflexota bacterium]
MQAEFRKLPSVEQFLSHAHLAPYVANHGPTLVIEAIRDVLTVVRQSISNGALAPEQDLLAQDVINRLESALKPSLQAVINATGVIIHTNLGRALLSDRAQTAMVQAATAYSNLEYSLEKGARGSRYVHAADLLCRLTGAESAVVVNNNASAVILTLMVLAQTKEVIISRGQLVEIGGGFRIPDIMTQSGAKLVEVGATNRAYIRDYESAIDPTETGLLLSVHHSNYQITGFTAQPTLAELVALARKYDLPMVEDLGSGTLLDTAPYGLSHEPTIQESVAADVDIITASGDKLLGGPQAGLILGKAKYIDILKKHPLIRALRVDKTTLAALQATLLAYVENKATEEIPVWRMISADINQLRRRARKWQTQLRQKTSAPVTVIDSQSTVGGGSLPGQTLPTKVLAISHPSLKSLATKLRQSNPPVIARIEADQLLLDPRTVLPHQDKALVEAVVQQLS